MSIYASDYYNVWLYKLVFILLFLSFFFLSPSDVHHPLGDGHTVQWCNRSSSQSNLLPLHHLDLLSSPRPAHQKDLRGASYLLDLYLLDARFFEYSSTTTWTKWIYTWLKINLCLWAISILCKYNIWVFTFIRYRGPRIMTVVFMLHYVTYSGYNNYLTAHFFVKAFSEILLNGE